MSSYYELRHCKKCNQMTNHLMADDTPVHHEYTSFCQKCGASVLKPTDSVVKKDNNSTDWQVKIGNIKIQTLENEVYLKDYPDLMEDIQSLIDASYKRGFEKGKNENTHSL